MNGVQTRFKCKLDVKRCKRFVFPPSSLLPRSNALKTKAIRYFQTDRTLTRIVSPPLLELERYARYAEQQERLISPEGTFPIVGRSLAYRFGAFHALSDVAYRKLLPERVKPAQVRSALSAIINRQVNAPGTFNPEGWLRVGFAGYQPHIGETYISTGSLYLCAAVFIALGLPESDEFWSSPSADWTCKKGWAGIDLDVDKALKK